MKRMVLTTAVATSVLVASATVYWRGTANTPIDWYDRSLGHGLWNTAADGGGTWKDCPVDENAHVKNGGIAVIGLGENKTVSGIDKLVVNFDYSAARSTVRIDEGGSLSAKTAYVTHGAKGNDGLLHVNGGSAVFGLEGGEGLQTPSSLAKSGAKGTVLVTGGALDVYSSFIIGDGDVATRVGVDGYFVMSNGTATAHTNLVFGKANAPVRGHGFIAGGRLVGVDGAELQFRSGSELVQEGGEVVFGRSIVNDSLLSLSGGTMDIGKLQLKKGGRVEVSGEMVLTGGLTTRGDDAAAGVTNEMFVSGGTVSVTNFAGNLPGTGTPYAWILAKNPFRYRQTGGSVSLGRLFTNSGESGDVRFSFEGGSFFGGPICVFDQPFFLRHVGSAAVSFENYRDATEVNKNENGVDCLVEHVIDRGAIAPIHYTENIGVSSKSHFHVFGKNVVRPAGGVQIVTNDVFRLFVCDKGAAPQTTYSSGGPDENLWTCGRIGKEYAWGVTLNSGVDIGALASGVTKAVVATPFGYASLPPVKTNKIERYTVTLGLVPQAATMSEIAESLSGAGYENVAADGNTVSLDVPRDWLVNGSTDSRLLFDFTETRCPDRFAVGEMFFPVTTNALVTSVTLSVKKPVRGLCIIFF